MFRKKYGFGSFVTNSGVAQPVSGGNTNMPTSGLGSLMGRQMSNAITPVVRPNMPQLKIPENTEKMLSQNPQMKQTLMANKFAALKQNNPAKYNELVKTIRERQTGISSARPLMIAMAKGGRVGYQNAGMVQPQVTQQQIGMIVTMLKKGADMSTISSIVGIPEQQIQMIVSKLQQNIQQRAKGGIASYQKGGMSSPNPDAERDSLARELFGKPLHQLTPQELEQLQEYIINKQAKGGIQEIDYRDRGGYVPPIGKKERADDIPAMLSNNEFVFTARAVRNAGGGDVKQGAKKMYALMKRLEGK